MGYGTARAVFSRSSPVPLPVAGRKKDEKRFIEPRGVISPLHLTRPGCFGGRWAATAMRG